MIEAVKYTEEHEELFKRAQKALEKWMEKHPPSEYNMDLYQKMKRKEALPADEYDTPWESSVMY